MVVINLYTDYSTMIVIEGVILRALVVPYMDVRIKMGQSHVTGDG